MVKREILDSEAMGRSLWRMAHEMIERTAGQKNLVFVGVETRGTYLAERLARLVEQVGGAKPDIVHLDTTPFRDDRRREGEPVPLGVPVDGRPVVIIDDVLYTGRTARAAIEAVLRAGRPSVIHLLVMVDRGHRELPIRPDFVGKNVPTARAERVQVHIKEVDGLDEVVLEGENGLDTGSDL